MNFTFFCESKLQCNSDPCLWIIYTGANLAPELSSCVTLGPLVNVLESVSSSET